MEIHKPTIIGQPKLDDYKVDRPSDGDLTENDRVATFDADGNILSKKYLGGTGTGISFLTRVDLGATSEIDWENPKGVYLKTMTADTTFTDINLPTGINTKEIAIYLGGEFTATFPSYWHLISDTSDPTKLNKVVAQCVIGDNGSEEVYYSIIGDSAVIIVPPPVGDLTTLKFTINTALDTGMSFTIPTGLTGTESYLYDVKDWGDGTETTGHTGDATHTYANDGIYQIEIDLQFSSFYFNGEGQCLMLTSIDQWGDVGYSATPLNSFLGCANLSYLADDCQALSNLLIEASSYLEDCAALTVLPENFTLNNLIVGSSMFSGTSITQLPVGMILGNLESGGNMFYASDLTSLPNVMTLDSLTLGINMFTSSPNLTGLENTQLTLNSMTSGTNFMSNCPLVDALPSTMTLAVADNGFNWFRDCPLLTLPTPITLSTLTQGRAMFQRFAGATYPSQLNCDNLTNGQDMWRYAVFTAYPTNELYPSLTNGYNMFQQSVFTELPALLTLADVTNMTGMFTKSVLTDLPVGITLSNMTAGIGAFTESTINTVRYSQLLNDLLAFNLNDNVSFTGGFSKYNASASAAVAALEARGWIFYHGGLEV